MSRGSQYIWRLVASEQDGPGWLPAARAAAGLASRAYGAGVWFNNSAFDLGLKTVRSLPAPVIGVGNLAVGGTGKTPLVMEIALTLKRMGLPVGVMSRGYGGQGGQPVLWVCDGRHILADAKQAGDEPVLMAQRLKVPLAVGPERYVVGKAMLAEHGFMVLVCDDLYQHRHLHRDLNILALDASDPLAGGRLLPRGRLREPASQIARADAVVLTRAQSAQQARQAREELAWRMEGKPVLSCRYQIQGFSDMAGNAVSQENWQGAHVLAFCGLARPGQFRRSLQQKGLKVLDLVAFDDHHPFSLQELKALWRRADTLDARAMVCSEKDIVRLPDGLPGEMAIWSAGLGLEFWEGPDALKDLLKQALDRWSQAA